MNKQVVNTSVYRRVLSAGLPHCGDKKIGRAIKKVRLFVVQFLLTFRSYFLCTTSLWLNMFLMTIRYVSSLSTLTRYIPRNCGSRVLP